MNTNPTSAGVEPKANVQHLTDFSSRQLFVGIDVHKERWQAAVFYQGIVLSNTSLPGNAPALIEHLHKLYPKALFDCVYEAGAWGFTLCRALWAAGMNCIVVNPADIPTNHKDARSKTDQVDARKLAMHHSAGLLQAIHVPAEDLQKQRSLVRFRKKVSTDLTRAKNRLKSQLWFQGIAIPQKFDKAHWCRNFLQWISDQAHKDPLLQDTLLFMLEEIMLLRSLLLKVELKLRELMKTEALKTNYDLLASVPGVGPQTATLFVLEVGDMKRFGNFDKLNRYVGLCPDTHSSAGTDRHTGLSVRGHSQLRSMLVESAWQLIRKDAAMLDSYKELRRRMDAQHAIVHIARRLLRRMRAVLLTQKQYVKGVQGAVTAKEIQAPDLPAPEVKDKRRKGAGVATAGLRSAD